LLELAQSRRLTYQRGEKTVGPVLDVVVWDYTIVAQEMSANKEYFLTTLYGQNYGRPGLYSFAILFVSRILGEQHILIAARLITVLATLLTGLTLAWLIRRICARVVEGEMFDSEAGAARAFQNDALVHNTLRPVTINGNFGGEAANKARCLGCRRHVSEEICT
jgi:hypothetical protein